MNAAGTRVLSGAATASTSGQSYPCAVMFLLSEHIAEPTM
jgi:hypothetical protein